MFTTGETYRDLGGNYFARRDPERATKRLIAKLQVLGRHVTSNQPRLEPRSNVPSGNSYAACEDSCRMARSPPAALAS
jgi:hypothetical protein